MLVASTGIGTALPGELDTDTTVAVGVGRGAAADHNRGQGAGGGGTGMDVAPMTVSHLRLPRDACTDGGNQVAVEVDLPFSPLLLAGFTVDDFGQVGTGFVGDGGDQEFALFQAIEIVLGVVGQRKGGTGGCAAHGALPGVLLHPGIDGLTLVEQHAFAVGRVLPGILAGVVLP